MSAPVIDFAEASRRLGRESAEQRDRRRELEQLGWIRVDVHLAYLRSAIDELRQAERTSNRRRTAGRRGRLAVAKRDLLKVLSQLGKRSIDRRALAAAATASRAFR